jgi:hypothetical protein
MRSRAFRRFQEAKKKEWVKRVFKRWRPLDKSQIGYLAHSPKCCSCYMCGNPRKHWKDKTMQEKRMDLYDLE